MHVAIEKAHRLCKEFFKHFSDRRNIYIPLFFAIVVSLVVLQYFFI